MCSSTIIVSVPYLIVNMESVFFPTILLRYYNYSYYTHYVLYSTLYYNVAESKATCLFEQIQPTVTLKHPWQ